MKIEAGKYYRTREGEKKGPMIPVTEGFYRDSFKFKTGHFSEVYTEDGSFMDDVQESGGDLIAEWSEPQPLKIEVGKFYMTRDGRRVGPMTGNNFKWVDGKGAGDDPSWENDGTSMGDWAKLISEWSEATTSPIRTIHRKEIVPGVYGPLTVYASDCRVGIKWHGFTTADEIRQAIQTLTEIADALEESVT